MAEFESRRLTVGHEVHAVHVRVRGRQRLRVLRVHRHGELQRRGGRVKRLAEQLEEADEIAQLGRAEGSLVVNVRAVQLAALAVLDECLGQRLAPLPAAHRLRKGGGAAAATHRHQDAQVRRSLLRSRRTHVVDLRDAARVDRALRRGRD